MAQALQPAYQTSERRVCRVLNFPRASHRYRSVADGQEALRMRLRELAATRVRNGYRRLHIFLCREGWRINHKRVHRLYVQEGLGLQTKRPQQHKSTKPRVGRAETWGANECWSMDFMSSELLDGCRIRPIVDCHTRESLCTAPGLLDTELMVFPLTRPAQAGRASPPAQVRAEKLALTGQAA